MKIIIAGGRDYNLNKKDYAFLNKNIHLFSEVVSGKCPSGADKCGEDWAKLNGIHVEPFKADWNKYGRPAGPIRNREMAQYADAVILFPGGRGTESMYQEAKKAGIKIIDCRMDKK